MNTCRQASTPEEIQNVIANLAVATAEEKDLFKRFLDNTIDGQEFVTKHGGELLIKLGFFIENIPSINAIIGSYEDFGIQAEPLKGGTWHTKTMVAINHDGVQYAVDDRGRYFMDNDKSSIEHSLNHYMIISTHYHERIKEVYDYLKTKTTDDIWAMTGGGCNMQVFFGNKDGYIGIFYLDNDDYIKVGSKDVKKIKAINTKKYTMSVQFEHNNHFFDNCTVKNIKIQKSDCVR